MPRALPATDFNRLGRHPFFNGPPLGGATFGLELDDAAIGTPPA